MNNDRLKFRFYEKRPTGFYIRYEFNDDYIINDGQVYEKFYGENGVTLELCENIIACQCTGLKDKNGVLIYEGDVLLHEESEGETESVYWCNESLRWNTTIDIMESDYGNAVEKIGNIYENPELLETP